MESGMLKNAIADFTEKFQTQKEEIDKQFEISSTLEIAKLPNHFQDLQIQLESLQKYLTDSVQFLRPYDIRICQESLKSLQDLLDQQQDSMIPKKKFHFKSRKKENEKKDETISTDCVDGPTQSIFNYDQMSCGFDNLKGERLAKRSEEIDGNEIDIRKLDECQVFLTGSPSAVRLTNLRRCHVYCGPVQTSVFIDNCIECVFMLACHQLRAHTSVDTDFYLHVTSSPIIEDCTRIRVAPYSLTYSGIENDFEKSGLNKLVNNWKLVNDFNWLAADMNSPNWQIIPIQERKEGKLNK